MRFNLIGKGVDFSVFIRGMRCDSFRLLINRLQQHGKRRVGNRALGLRPWTLLTNCRCSANRDVKGCEMVKGAYEAKSDKFAERGFGTAANVRCSANLSVEVASDVSD